MKISSEIKLSLKILQSKHEVYGHVLGTHLATAQEEVVSQYDFNEDTILVDPLKVTKFQNEFMKSSFPPKYDFINSF